MRRLKFLLAPLLVLALIAAACGDSDEGGAEETDTDATQADESADSDASSDDESGDEGDSDDSGDSAAPVARGEQLAFGMPGVPQSLQASQAEYGNANLWFQALYDGLLRIEPDGKTLYPWLATDWEYNEDNTVLTMNLRDDILFSDGTPFNAEAAAQNLLRFRDGGGTNASYFNGLGDVVVVDDTTIEIQLDAPNPGLLGYLADTGGLMQAPSSFDAADADQCPIGSGPYVIDCDRTVPDSEYYFVARDDYFSPETVHYDELKMRIIADRTAIVNALLADEVDAANPFSAAAVPQLVDAGWDTHEQRLDWVGLSLIDRCGDFGTPLDNLLVRQAISHAMDKEGILETFGNGYGEPTGQVFNTSSAGYDPALNDLYPYDPERAKELMAESGVEPFTITMPALFAIWGDALFSIMAENLAEIGITVEWDEPAPADFISDLLTPKYPAYFMFLEQNPNDWTAINFLMAPTATWNPGGCTDDVVEGLVSDIQVSTDEAEQDELVAQLGRHVIEEAWYVPFYQNDSVYVTDGTVDVEVQIGNAIPFLWNYMPKG